MRRSWIAIGIVAATVMPWARLCADPCLTSRPSPHCSSFFVTELGYAFKFTEPLARASFTSVGDSITSAYEYRILGRHLIHSELGVMYNISPKYALGFTHFTGWDVGSDIFGGVKLRGRRWLSESASVDVSAGALLWSTEDASINRPSFIGSASWNFSHWQSVELTVTSTSTKHTEFVYDVGGVPYRSYSPAQREVGVYLGHKLASKPGLVMNGVALVTTSVVVGLIIGSLANSN